MPASISSDFTEHPNWREKHPLGPVTWDGMCQFCGFTLTDCQWSSGYAIEGLGRKLGRVRKEIILGEVRFHSSDTFIACSKCCPNIL